MMNFTVLLVVVLGTTFLVTTTAMAQVARPLAAPHTPAEVALNQRLREETAEIEYLTTQLTQRHHSLAQTSYTLGLLAQIQLDYAQAVRHFTVAHRYNPTNPVYAEALARAQDAQARTKAEE